jgi:hypothetical protein
LDFIEHAIDIGFADSDWMPFAATRALDLKPQRPGENKTLQINCYARWNGQLSARAGHFEFGHNQRSINQTGGSAIGLSATGAPGADHAGDDVKTRGPPKCSISRRHDIGVDLNIRSEYALRSVRAFAFANDVIAPTDRYPTAAQTTIRTPSAANM